MEIVVAVTFVGFLVGFIAVLCVGNYFRAKKAMERQRQRRLARLVQQNSNTMSEMSPNHAHFTSQNSVGSSVYSDEQQSLLGGGGGGGPRHRGQPSRGGSNQLPAVGLGSVDYLDNGNTNMRPQYDRPPTTNDYYYEEENRTNQVNADMMSV